MKGLIQRVKQASVTVDEKVVGSIETGLLLFLGVEKDDSVEHVEKMARKVHNYRIFPDEYGKMNRSLLDIDGQLLVVSQFTLVADTSKGNRPGFSRGASPEHGKQIYQSFVEYVNETYARCETGQFGADMQVALVNDGPVTFHLSC
jgi:D-tyrosyl-tRNA(Tyr) deacylase